MVSENSTVWEVRKELRSIMMHSQWEVPVLVLISLTFQVVLVLLSNCRRYLKSRLLSVVLWSAYMAASAVATLALSVISNNLTMTKVLDSTGQPLASQPLDPLIELQAFWAPFFLLHLGGPDTITAFGTEDNELWRRHLLSLVVQTGLTLYILFETHTKSTLTVLSAMMFSAGFIKYAERTWCLWSASYERCRQKAKYTLFRKLDEISGEYEAKNKVLTLNDFTLAKAAIMMFPDTEGMFVDAYMKRESGYNQGMFGDPSLYWVQYDSDMEGKSFRFTDAMKLISSTNAIYLIEVELKMMYDNLYTKAPVILSYTGLALRFISFLLTCITLILFSSSGGRQRYLHNITEYKLTVLLFAVSIGLEIYAAFVFLSLYRTIFWFKEHGMGRVARIMENLAKLRTRSWSNSMGQFSDINYFMQYNPKRPLFMSWIFSKSSFMWLHVYHRPVPHELKAFIHEYLRGVSMISLKMYTEKKLFFVQSKGIVPWDQYFLHENVCPRSLKYAYSLFNKEFEEMIIFLQLVTEVCYYMDRSVFDDRDHEYEDICRVSKYLSRYLMHLFVVSSDLLPQRTPLSKRKFYEDLNPSWQPFFTPHWNYIIARGQGRGEVKGQDAKKRRREFKERICRRFWEISDIGFGNTRDIDDLRFARNLLKVLRPNDVTLLQLKRRWKLLNATWVELLVYAADQCKGKAHARHLTKGEELLTHVWVLLGHFGFIDEALLPFNEPPELQDEIETDQLSSPV